MGLRDASASQNTTIGILSAGNGGGMFSVKWTFCKFFLGVASSWQGGLLSTSPGKAPQGKKTIPIVEHGPEWSEYIVEVWAIFWTTPGSEPKNFLLVGWQSSTPGKGKSPNFFLGRLPAATWCSTLCMGHISFESTFPGKWIFLLKWPGFLLKILVLGSCEHLADWWSKPVLSTLRDGNRASLLHPYIKPPVFWGINFKLKIIDWAWLFVAFVRFVYIS